jgi:hypothetical protein
MKCDKDGCDKEAIGFGTIHDNLTDKRFKVHHCIDHGCPQDGKAFMDLFRKYELHEYQKQQDIPK